MILDHILNDHAHLCFLALFQCLGIATTQPAEHGHVRHRVPARGRRADEGELPARQLPAGMQQM